MSKEMICCWCGEKMMYSVLGQNLTSSHFCDNNKCKAFQMVLPDNLWKDIFAWNQSQHDLQICVNALKDIEHWLGVIRCSMVSHLNNQNNTLLEHYETDPTVQNIDKAKKILKHYVAQITHDNKDKM